MTTVGTRKLARRRRLGRVADSDWRDIFGEGRSGLRRLERYVDEQRTVWFEAHGYRRKIVTDEVLHIFHSRIVPDGGRAYDRRWVGLCGLVYDAQEIIHLLPRFVLQKPKPINRCPGCVAAFAAINAPR